MKFKTKKAEKIKKTLTKILTLIILITTVVIDVNSIKITNNSLSEQNQQLNGKQISSELALSSFEKSNIMTEINNQRVKAAKQSTVIGEKLPKGKNIIKMFWDELLNQKANQHVTSCPPTSNAHSTTQFRTDTSKGNKGEIQGEVVYFEAADQTIKEESRSKERNNPNFANMFKTIEQVALQEATKNNVDLQSLINNYNSKIAGQSKLLADYLQIVKAKAYKVGCAHTCCEYPDKKIYKVYVCLFNKGMKEGGIVYGENNYKNKKQFDPILYNSALIAPKGYLNQMTFDKELDFTKEIVYVKKSNKN